MRLILINEEVCTRPNRAIYNTLRYKTIKLYLPLLHCIPRGRRLLEKNEKNASPRDLSTLCWFYFVLYTYEYTYSYYSYTAIRIIRKYTCTQHRVGAWRVWVVIISSIGVTPSRLPSFRLLLNPLQDYEIRLFLLHATASRTSSPFSPVNLYILIYAAQCMVYGVWLYYNTKRVACTYKWKNELSRAN